MIKFMQRNAIFEDMRFERTTRPGDGIVRAVFSYKASPEQVSGLVATFLVRCGLKRAEVQFTHNELLGENFKDAANPHGRRNNAAIHGGLNAIEAHPLYIESINKNASFKLPQYALS